MPERAAKRQRLKHKHSTHPHKKTHKSPPRTPTSSSSSSSSSTSFSSSSPSLDTSTQNLPPFRKATVKALETLLQTTPTHTQQSKELALQIESALFSTHGNTGTPPTATTAYTNKLRSLKYNISQNADLKKRILNRDISPAAVPRLTPEEMLPPQERNAQREIEAHAYELSRLDHVDPLVKEALMGSSSSDSAGGGKEGGGIGAEEEEEAKEGEDEKKGEGRGASLLTSSPLAVARGGEGGEVFSCERCGSKNIGHVHRNALEDEQERMLECSCNSCGAVWVVED